MLKAAAKKNYADARQKKASNKPQFIGALASGLNRRAFLKQASILLLAGNLLACKPNVPIAQPKSKKPQNLAAHDQHFTFDQQQQKIIQQVQMILFPDDGDGPSAHDINALDYLQWALTDNDNAADGDDEFIVNGIGWLNELSEQSQGAAFIKLSEQKQQQVLARISQSSAGENWLSLLIYYLIEALLFDPFYGGNTDQVGWQWLQHQPGFPRPDTTTHYRRFS